MAKQKDLSKTYIGESTTFKDIFKQMDENYKQKSNSDEKLSFMTHHFISSKSFTNINNYYFLPPEDKKDYKNFEQYLLNYYKSLLPSTKHADTSLHQNWWAKLSTVDKLRNHPREFLSYGTLGLFLITLFLLLAGLLLDRIILMPDFGVAILILSFVFWLMTQFSK